MEFLEQFSEITLGFAVEFIKLLPIMIFVFEFKLQSVKKVIIFVTSAVVLLVLSAAYVIAQYVPIYTYISLLLTLSIIRGNNRIIYILISYFGIGILDMLTATVWLLFNERSYGQLADDPIKHIIINSINIVTVFIICILSKVFLSKQKHISPQNAGKLYLFLLLFGELSLLMFITAFQLNEDAIDGSEEIMAVCLSVGSIVFLLTAVILLINHISKEHFKNICEVNEKLIRSQEQYYTMLLQKEEETRKFRHDISNHLNCMRLLFENKKYNELNDYFKKVGAALLELHSRLQLGNDIIGAILKDISDKYPMVSLDIIGIMPATLRLDNTDICTIFYNLFDNAFSAAERSEEKSVEIFIKLLGENLFFVIKNTVSCKIEIFDNILQTEKRDKERHGFGSGNAVMCAEKNGGTLTYKCSDTYFEAELIHPNINSTNHLAYRQ